MKKQRIKISIMLSAVVIGIFGVIFGTTRSAWADNQGSEATAQQKVYYQTLKKCVSQASNYYNTNFWGNITTELISGGKLFYEPGAIVGTGLGVQSGAWAENLVTGAYDDGKIYCGENGNSLVHSASSQLNFAYNDLICDYSSTDNFNGGVLSPSSSSQSCGDALKDNDSKFNVKNDRSSYLEKLVKAKNPSVPGGSMDTFTDLENYYLYYNTFTLACAGSTPHFDNPENYAFQIMTYDSSSNSFKNAGYSAKSGVSASTNVKVTASATEKCSAVATKINKDSNYFKAYQTFVNAKIESGEPIEDVAPSGGDDSGAKSDPCYSGDIESMSWILCPATKNMAKATDGLNGMIEDMLAVDTDLYSQTREDGSASGTYIAWGYFRDIANIAMIIVIMIVIFSQLTGTGIDNYGIKKLLPKLIVSAVLVNLSYIICTLAIDLSNILGSSLNLMFQSIGKTIGVENYAQITISSLVTGILGAVTAAGAGAALIVEGISLLGTSGATTMVLIIPLLIALIIAIVAVVMFYVMLGARMIIIIIFTALSPLAFVCNILPNTQSLFKKWLDVMKAALIMFPICGALYGLSFVIKAIVFSTDGVHIWMGIVAVFSPFIPFLVMPTLLKSAISALGVVGQKLAGIGDTMKGSLRNAQSAVRNSEQYREAARLGQLQHGNWRANRTLNGTKGIGRRHIFARKGLNSIPEGDLTESQVRRRAEAQRAIGAYETEMADARYGSSAFITDDATRRKLTEDRAKSRARSQEFKNYTDQYGSLTRTAMEVELNSAITAYSANRNSQNSTRLQAAIAAAESKGMNKELVNSFGRAGGLSLQGDHAEDANVLNQLASSSNKIISNYAKQRNKNSTTSMSLHDFTTSTSTTDSLAAAFKNKGAEVLNGMDDDSLSYLSGTNAGAVNTATLLNAAASTSNQKELTQINTMLKGRSDLKISLGQLSKLDPSTFGAILSDPASRSAIQNGDFLRSYGDPQNATIRANMNAAIKTSMDNLYAAKFGHKP